MIGRPSNRRHRACRPGASPPTSWMACCAGAVRSTSCSMAGRPRLGSTRSPTATARWCAISWPPRCAGWDRSVTCSISVSSVACRRKRRGSSSPCWSGPRRSCFSTFPTTRRSICRCVSFGPTATRRATASSPTRCCGGSRATAPTCSARSTRSCSIRRSWLMERWTHHYGTEWRARLRSPTAPNRRLISPSSPTPRPGRRALAATYCRPVRCG